MILAKPILETTRTRLVRAQHERMSFKSLTTPELSGGEPRVSSVLAKLKSGCNFRTQPT